jgi:hypothetical protein
VLDPKPDGAQKILFDQASRHQIAITVFETAHHALQTMLGKGLRVPQAASAKVLGTITQLASIVTIHSEIANLATDTKPRGTNARGNKAQATDAAVDETPTSIVSAKKVIGDTRPHLHLLPSGAGLRAEFYVQPFGATGPTCRPGEGGTTLFASIDGEATSASRDLAAEAQRAQAVLERCSTIATHLTEAWSATFPTPLEALELLLDLEQMAQSEDLTMHWPKGRSLQLVGEATESMMRLKIRRDGNWFAASGELKIDRDRSIDMMQLLELVSATPGRFVKLGDGEFLALTNALRQQSPT